MQPEETTALRDGSRAPVKEFALAAAFGAGGLVLGTAVLFGLADSLFSLGGALVVYLGAVALCVHGLRQDYPHARLGLCNRVTLARLVMTCLVLVALLHREAPGPALLALAILSLALDGVDGWLARREGLTSRFGARFDVEVDAGFALLLAAHSAVLGTAGAHVLLLGLPYYLFGAAKHLWPWLDRPLPEAFSRKAICVLQIAALIALLVPQLGGRVMEAAILGVVVALAWSFGRDILWLYRSRA